MGAGSTLSRRTMDGSGTRSKERKRRLTKMDVKKTIRKFRNYLAEHAFH